MTLAGNSAQRKLRNEDFARHLAEASGATAVTLGVFDSAGGFFLELWTGVAPGHDRPGHDHKQETDRFALARMLRDRLSACAGSTAEAGPDGMPLLRAGAMVVGIGQNTGHLWPVIAVEAPPAPEDGKLRPLLALGLSHLVHQVADIAAPARPQPDSLQDEALRTLSVHFAVVDAQGVIDHSVNLSPDWLQQHGGFEIQDGRLVACSKKVQKAFLEALQRATAEMPQSAIVAVRDDPGSARLVWVSPLEGRRPARALVILERGSDYLAMREHLLKLAGLTKAERRVAHQVLLGKSLPEVAEETGLAVSTVRSYMKNIFQKTNTRRQSEFVSRYQSALLRMRLSAGEPPAAKT